MNAPVAIQSWATACPDWEDRILEGRSLIPDLPLFDQVAEKALRVFKALRDPDLHGNPTFGEICDEWVFDLVRAVFGSYNPVTRQRMIRQFFVMIPKKNGKSSIAAAMIVVAAILNDRPNAELILIAETQKIAGIAFRTASGIIALDERLNDQAGGIFHVSANSKTITHLITGATIRILSADGDVVTGSKAAYVLIDETHVLAHKSKAAGVYLELEGGLASRPDGFVMEITTQSKVRPHGEFARRLKRARDVRDGKLDLPLLPLLYELPARMQTGAEWRDEATWWLVNPNLERSVSLDFLRDKYLEAKEGGADALALFASQHLNIEIGVGLHSDGWVGADYWAQCAQPGLTLDAIIETSDMALVGADGGGRDDLFGLAVIGRHAKTRVWQIWAHAWCLDSVPRERRKGLSPLLNDFARAGELGITTSEAQIVREAAEFCCRLRDAGLLPKASAIGIDLAKAAAFEDELVANGFELNGDIVGVPQTWQLQRGIGRLEGRLIDGRACHGGQKILDWAVGNARAEIKNNNIYITKQAAGVAKIDPLMALFNAAFLMTLNPEPPINAMIRVPEGYEVF